MDMNKIKYADLFYSICSVRVCSACWREQKVIQNFSGKNEETRPPGKGSADRRIRIQNVEETEWDVVDWSDVALNTDQWLTLEKTEIIIWDT